MSGTISTEPASAVVTNTRLTGGLKVTKTVVSSTASDKEGEFSFVVTLSDETISKTYSGVEFTGGTGRFTLKDGETRLIEGLPTGITYTVTEETAAGFIVTKTGETGTISADTTAEAAFTNTKEEGGLMVTKKVVSSLASDKTKDFTFTVTLSDTTVSGAYEEMTFTGGVATFTLKDGETKSATGLAKGISYTVTETADDLFEITYSGETGAIGDTIAEITVTNTRKTGELQVTKTVESSTASDRTRDFGFKVTLGDSSISGTYGEMTFTGGVAEFTLKHGEAKLAASLPVGISYTVEENAGSGYTVTMTGETGSISVTRAVAAFTNTFTTPPPPPPPDTPPSPPDTPPTPPTPPETPYVLGATRTPQVLGASRAQTGDDSDLQLWLTLMLASATGMIAALKKRRKREEA